MNFSLFLILLLKLNVASSCNGEDRFQEVDYCKLCSQPGSHTLCKFASSKANQTQSTLSDADKLTILQSHNNFRSNVAQGKVTKQPSASNMLRMRWDTELAYVAGKWAEQGVDGHDTCRDSSRFAVGQNIAWKSDWDLEGMMQMWYDEVKDFNGGGVNSFGGGGSTGHYTQAVWAKSFLIGCAHVDRGPSVGLRHMFVCNYGPAGNMVGDPVYKKGDAQAECSAESAHPDSEFAGLCDLDQKALGNQGITPTNFMGFLVWPGIHIKPTGPFSHAPFAQRSSIMWPIILLMGSLVIEIWRIFLS